MTESQDQKQWDKAGWVQSNKFAIEKADRLKHSENTKGSDHFREVRKSFHDWDRKRINKPGCFIICDQCYDTLFALGLSHHLLALLAKAFDSETYHVSNLEILRGFAAHSHPRRRSG